MMEGKSLFQHNASTNGEHDIKAHLAEMIALLGPPPQELIARDRKGRDVTWGDKILGRDGTSCPTPCQFFGGPFFNDEGKRSQIFLIMTYADRDHVGEFMFKELIPAGITLEGTIESLEGDEKQLFLNFAKKMLRWLPDDRKTAKELLEDPWLGLPTG